MRYKTILVSFVQQDGSSAGNKDYAYFTDLDLVKGDVVVVQARDFCGLARVVKTTGLIRVERDAATRWVICKVDFDSVSAKEEKMRVVQEIKGMLQEYKEKFEEEQIYRLLAKDDPKIAALLTEYDKLMLE